MIILNLYNFFLDLVGYLAVFYLNILLYYSLDSKLKSFIKSSKLTLSNI